MNDDGQKSLVAEFVEEASDYIEKIEVNIMEYEKNQSDAIKRSILNDLHSIKGTAQAVGLELLAKEVHDMEGVITQESKPIDSWLEILDDISTNVKSIDY